MKKLFIFCFSFLILALFTCKQSQKGTYDYSSLQVDTNKIVIFKWDSTFYNFPKFSEPLVLTDEDVRLVDSFLVDAVDTFNQTISIRLYESFEKAFPVDSFRIVLPTYKRQYFPYKDNNGNRVFQVICFSNPFVDWRTKPYSGRRHGGISHFSIRINLSYKKADEISTGGYG